MIAIANTPSLNASIRAVSLAAIARRRAGARQQLEQRVRWHPCRRGVADRSTDRDRAARSALRRRCGRRPDRGDRRRHGRQPRAGRSTTAVFLPAIRRPSRPPRRPIAAFRPGVLRPLHLTAGRRPGRARDRASQGSAAPARRVRPSRRRAARSAHATSRPSSFLARCAVRVPSASNSRVQSTRCSGGTGLNPIRSGKIGIAARLRHSTRYSCRICDGRSGTRRPRTPAG